MSETRLNKVCKYRLRHLEEIMVPEDHRFLHLGMDSNDDVCAYVLVDPEATRRKIVPMIYGTGHELPQLGQYVGTAITPSCYVWHVFTDTQNWRFSMLQPDNSVAYSTKSNG